MSECPICYEAINKNTGVSTLACSHSYHLKCIATWLTNNDSCPCCRREVNEHEKLSALPTAPPTAAETTATANINIVGEEGYSDTDANVADTLIHLDASESMINRFLRERLQRENAPRTNLLRVNAQWNVLMNPEEGYIVNLRDRTIYGR